MVFLVDDILEGVTIMEAISIIGSEVMAEITGVATTATATVGNLFNNILGSEGTSALLNFVKMGAGEQIAVDATVISNTGNVVIENEGLLLWEAVPEIQQVSPKGVFVQNFQKLGQALIKNGVNMKDLSARDLLKKLVLTAIKKGKTGIIAGSIGTSILAPIGIKKLVNKFRKSIKKKPSKIKDESLSEIKRF